jgi:hypothetical protein
MLVDLETKELVDGGERFCASLAPVITIALSLAIYSRMPLPAQWVGLVLAVLAIYLMAE